MTHFSSNVGRFIACPSDDLIGVGLEAIVSPASAHTIRNQIASLAEPDNVARAFAMQLQDDGAVFDLAIHRSGHTIIIEAELSEPAGEINAGAMVRAMLRRTEVQSSLSGLARESARLVQALTGYDRVMVYRFQADQSGEIIAEHVRAGLEPYLGLHYPASDIPLQARALLLRNPVRTLIDVAATPVPIVGLRADTVPLDLSMSTLRAHSLMHIEYLQNMGVGATMTLSIVCDGKLWGLIFCHHMTPRHIGFERRTTAELFSYMLALLIERSETRQITEYEVQTRRLHARMLAMVAETGSVGDSIVVLKDEIAQLVPSDGIAVCVDGKITQLGSTPTPSELLELCKFIDKSSTGQVYASEELGKVYPPAQAFVQQAAGLLAIPISRSPRDYLMFFRHEVARSVTWAGVPTKTAIAGPDGIRLSPRKSFEAWREIKNGASNPWTEAQLRVAEALRATLLEVVLRLLGASELERHAAAQKQDLLIAELNHRVRNILGLIRGLIGQSRASANDLDTFARVLGDRVHALARAHDQITAKNWGPGSLATLVATEAGAYLDNNAERVRVNGPGVLLEPQAFSTMALVVHELMTNAAKYGALSTANGHVTIDWTLDPSGSLNLDWTELGGPAVQLPSRRGFGSTIIEHSIPHELGGEARIEFKPMGMSAHFTLPGRHFVQGDTDHPIKDNAVQSKPEKMSGTALLVEDNIIIALDCEEMLESLGIDRVIIASGVSDALNILETQRPDFALLDVNLGSETSFPVATRLRQLGIPHIFATGYGTAIELPFEHRSTPVITKPYTASLIERHFNQALMSAAAV